MHEPRVTAGRVMARTRFGVIVLTGVVLLGMAGGEGIFAQGLLSVAAGITIGALTWRARHRHTGHRTATLAVLPVRNLR